MAIRAWLDADLRLALRLLQWAQPNHLDNSSQLEKLKIEEDLENKDEDWAFIAA